jgi:Bifunctional DNA primase/polymerase, N-terminal
MPLPHPPLRPDLRHLVGRRDFEGGLCSETSDDCRDMIDIAKLASAITEASETHEPIVAALAYTRAGLPVFPCNQQDKTPLTRCGFKDATTEPRQIRIWWTRWPGAMIGVPTGPESGLFVLDVDVDTERNTDGFSALAALEKRFSNLPETLRSATPRGGSHYFFPRAPWNQKFRGQVGAWPRCARRRRLCDFAALTA